MDILKKEIAPISEKAWEEIEDSAKEVLTSILSARRVLKVNGPKGWDYNAVPTGRLKELDKGSDKGKVCTGVYEQQNLVEARIVFELDKWELDNIDRGAKDAELDDLEAACEALAMFEEEAIYNGYKKGNIEGLVPAAGHKLSLGKEGNTILKNISKGKYALFNSYAEVPFDLVVSPDAYERINVIVEGVRLYDLIKEVIQGDIIRSKAVKGAVMLPHRDEDIEFTVGQDFAVGFEADAGDKVRMFVTETFTLRVLDPDKVVAFSM